MTRRDRIMRLAKLRGDKAALAIMEADRARRNWETAMRHLKEQNAQELLRAEANLKDAGIPESELRALWGDR